MLCAVKPDFPYHTAAIQTPTIRELSLLPVDDWFLAGIQLGVEEYELRTIEQNYSKDSKRCKYEMFIVWLKSDPNASYEKLVKALPLEKEALLNLFVLLMVSVCMWKPRSY